MRSCYFPQLSVSITFFLIAFRYQTFIERLPAVAPCTIGKAIQLGQNAAVRH